MKPFVICVTGGIASGKTFVSDYMGQSGFNVIDADLVAREVVEKGQPTLKELIAYFGNEILDEGGGLNRRKLKNIVFNDGQKLSKLNQIVHPAIEKKINEKITLSDLKSVILVIPLLNTEMIDLYRVNRVLVIDVDNAVQINRVVSRDGVGIELAEKIINSQQTRNSRIKLATDVIVNNGTMNELKQNVSLVLRFYQNLVEDHLN